MKKDQSQGQSIIIDAVYTLEQLRALTAEIAAYGRLAATRKRPSTILLEVMSANQITKLTREAANNLVRAIAQHITTSKITQIRTATPLEVSQQQAIVAWFSQLSTGSRSPMLVSFRTDPSLIAGVAVQTPTNTYDWSLSGGQAAGQEYLRNVVRAA